jgi:hypothetical protein
MKKLLLTATTLAMLSTAVLAEKPTESTAKMEEMRHSFMVMTQQLMDTQMQVLKSQEEMLTNYQKLLKQMMENESSSHSG